MLGRLWAIGYMKGLMQSVEHELKRNGVTLASSVDDGPGFKNEILAREKKEAKQTELESAADTGTKPKKKGKGTKTKGPARDIASTAAAKRSAKKRKT